MRLRSVRIRALIVVLAVVLLPLAFVWGSVLGDRAAGAGYTIVADLAASEAAEAWPDVDAIDALARRRGLRIRVLDRDDRLIHDADHSGSSLAARLGDRISLGPEPPSLAAAEGALGPVSEREEVERARARGVSRDCTHAEGLLVCWSARTTLDGAVVHVQDATARPIRTLYEVRWQLVNLTVYVLGVGLILAIWLGARFVRPLERLRGDVLARRRGAAVPLSGLDRDDEIGDLGRAFQELLAALDDRNEANAAFAADLAHEMKNPVAAVRACAEALEGDRPLDAERAARLSRVLADSSRRLDLLVTRFLELARAEAGLPGVVREDVDLAALAGGLVEHARADERCAGVTVEIVARPAVVHGVSERLEAAVRNLLDNAVAFAGDGGTVRVEVGCDDGVVRLTVSDSGPGIDAEDLPRVFDRFHTRRPGGTGLGLPLARAVIEAHGGRVTASSPPGGGARFEIRLPSA